jgi:TPR repeat protein
LGFPPAQHQLGNMYYEGSGVPKADARRSAVLQRGVSANMANHCGSTANAEVTVKYRTSAVLPQGLRFGGLVMAWRLRWHTAAVCGLFNGVLPHRLVVSVSYAVIDQGVL